MTNVLIVILLLYNMWLVYCLLRWREPKKRTARPEPSRKPETDTDKLYTKIGVYEGAGYSLKGIYRPTTECRMKINEAPRFCPVCIRSLEKLIHFYTE